MSGNEPVWLKTQGASWWHSDDYASPRLHKSSMGEFFYHVLSSGAHIGEVWVFNRKFRGSGVYVSVFMTEAMKAEIEAATRYRFRTPPKINLNSTTQAASQ